MQNGQVYQNGRWWRLRYYEHVRDASGNVIKKRATAKLALISERLTADELEAKARAILAPHNTGEALPESVETLSSFIRDVYMPAIERELKPSTVRSYKVMYALVSPYLNGTKLREVRTSDIDRILRDIAESKARAKTSLNNARNFLSGAFRYAIRTDRYVRENPVREAKVPKGVKPQPENTHAYTLEEITAILAALDEPARTVCAVAAFSGLRKGEIMGLRWEDYTGEELYVRRAVWRTYIGETKTASSTAPVPVIPALRRVLDAHRRRTTSTGWIFAGERKGGKAPLNLANLLRREMRPKLDKAKIEWHGWHGFRRGLGSNLYALGVPDMVIQRILRHSDVTTTQQHYIKTADAAAVKAMQQLEKALRKNGRKR